MKLTLVDIDKAREKNSCRLRIVAHWCSMINYGLVSFDSIARCMREPKIENPPARLVNLLALPVTLISDVRDNIKSMPRFRCRVFAGAGL